MQLLLVLSIIGGAGRFQNCMHVNVWASQPDLNNDIMTQVGFWGSSTMAPTRPGNSSEIGRASPIPFPATPIQLLFVGSLLATGVPATTATQVMADSNSCQRH
jgi:hypothetical protein